MIIEKDRIVSFHYQLNDRDGRFLENSHDAGNPSLYMHGQRGMLEGIETSLEGKAIGDKVTVTLSPEEAYGNKRENMQTRMSVKHIRLRGGKPIRGKLKPGTIIGIKSKDGVRDATVIKHGLKSVDIDTNHPYAGMTLVFNIDVVDVREATAEEVTHGHAHGAGGHEH